MPPAAGQRQHQPDDAQVGSSSTGNLVCSQSGSFPTHGPYGNATCSLADGVKTFGLNTADGCPLSSPPKTAANSSGLGRAGSFFGTLMGWMYPAMRDAKASVRWIRANAEKYKLDTDHITAIGGSAGACR